MSRYKIKKKKVPNLYAPKKEIKLNGRIGFGLHANTEHLLNILKEMNDVQYGGIIIIDFSDVDFLYPSGLNTIVCTGINLIVAKNQFIKQRDPKNRDVSDFLDYSGFRDIVGIGMRDSKIEQPDTTYKIHPFDNVDDNEISKLIDVIENELNMSLSVKIGFMKILLN
jgi:hypothetical protein